MIYFLIIFFIVLLILGLKVSNNNIFSPSVITPAIWAAMLLMFFILDHNLPPLSYQFLVCIMLWCGLYTISSMLAQATTRATTLYNRTPSQTILNLYFLIALCTFPLFLQYAYTAITMGPTGHWAIDLRLASTGKHPCFSEPIGFLYVGIWRVAYIIELVNYSKKNRIRVLLLLFFMLSYGIITMSKLVFLELFISTAYILYANKKIKLKHLIIGGLILIQVFILMQTIRNNLGDSDKERNDFFVLYLIGHMSAFDILEPCSSTYFGENVFRMFYAILNYFKISSIEPVAEHLPWISEPLRTNTYTTMYPFFKDFGYIGVVIFAIFNGLLWGTIFKKTTDNDKMYIVIYAFFIHIIIDQYVNEMIFSSLSGNIKKLILLLLPYFFRIRKKEISNNPTT